MEQQLETGAKPFLKWAGGKSQLIAEIEKRFPFSPDDRFTYVEPFVGGGAVLFWVLNNFPKIEKVVINDVNSDLVGTYEVIRDSVEELIDLLSALEGAYHKLADDPSARRDCYNKKRDQFNSRSSGPVTQAALMIFLNKTGFNGLYRVNRGNGFNVPMGNYRTPLICNRRNLRTVSQALQKVKILNGDFAKTGIYAGKNAFFYFDPPYKPLSSTSNFNTYARGGFDDSEQERLKLFCDRLANKNCKWVLSNSDVKGLDPNNTFFDDLYSEYQISRVWAKRSINSNPSKRGKLTELLIFNYDNGSRESPAIPARTGIREAPLLTTASQPQLPPLQDPPQPPTIPRPDR